MLDAARELWPFETSWPDWSPQSLFELWKIHRDYQLGKREFLPLGCSNDYCRQLMLLVALNLSRKRRMESLDRCGKGASDAAQEYVMHLYTKSSRFTMEKEHPLVLIKAFNTSISRLIADTMDASRGQAVNASTLSEEEDALQWIPGGAAPQRSDVLLNRLEEPKTIEALCDEVESMGTEDSRPAIRRAILHQTNQMAKHNNLPSYDCLPERIGSSIDPETLMLINTRIQRMVQDLVLSN